MPVLGGSGVFVWDALVEEYTIVIMVMSDIARQGWVLYRQWLGWFFWPLIVLLIGLTVIAEPLLGSFGWSVGAWVLFLVGYGYMEIKARQEFWRKFAESKGWAYTQFGSLDGEKALMFSEGRGRQVRNVVEGKFSGRPLRLFEYQFTTGSGKQSKTHYYTVFALVFKGRFPHLYLNRKRAGRTIGAGRKISLPSAYEAIFELRGPEQYEIEALEVFTDEVLVILLQQNWRYDIEIVEGELVVFVHEAVGNITDLERMFGEVGEIMELLASKLDTMSFEEIGHYPYSLRNRKWFG